MPPVGKAPKRSYEKVKSMDELMDTDEEVYDEDTTKQQSMPQTMEDIENESHLESGEKAAAPPQDKTPKPNYLMKRQVAILQKKLEAERASGVTNDTPVYSQNQLWAIEAKLTQRVNDEMIKVAGISAGIGIIVGFLGARYFFSTASSHVAASAVEVAETVV